MALLNIKGISKSFGGLKALNDVNLEVQEGSIHAIIGPNGAGKSTLLNVLVGKLIPDAGIADFDDQSLLGKKPEDINQMGVARVFQTPEIFGDMTLLENVMLLAMAKADGQFKMNMFMPASKRNAIIDECVHEIEQVGLQAKLDMLAKNLSRGDKRRLELAMAMIQNPRLLLLDEPTAGMSRADTNEIIELLKNIHACGMTKVIIEHDMHVVFSLSKTISVMAQGTVIFNGTPEEARASDKVQEAYLGGEH